MHKKSLLFIALLLSFLAFNPKATFAEETVDLLNNKIEEYNKKLEELGKAKDTLANQIKILDSQVELTLLKINQTENNIKTLQDEISQLSTKIEQLDSYLDVLSTVYIHEVNQNYKLQKRVPSFAFLLSSKFNDYWEQQKYITSAQKNSQSNMLAMETTRTNYDIQKAQKTKKTTRTRRFTTKVIRTKKQFSKAKTI